MAPAVFCAFCNEAYETGSLPGMKIREESDAFVIQGRFGNRVDLPPFSLLKLLDRDNRKQKYTLSILWLAELHEILYALN